MRRRSGKAVVVLPGAVFLCGVFAVAQEPQPTFRTGTTLVEFTLVALDNKGKPVTDLTKDDIVLTDGNQRRDIAFFRFEGGPPQSAETMVPTLPPAGFITNRFDFPMSAQTNVTAIVMDLINTAPNFQVQARTAMLKQIRSLPPHTRAALFRFSDTEPMAVVQPFTDRGDLLESRLAEFNGAARSELFTPDQAGPAVVGADCEWKQGELTEGQKSIEESINRDVGDGKVRALNDRLKDEARAMSSLNEQVRNRRLTRTIANLEALGDLLSRIPGRKSVIWVTGGMPAVLSPIREIQTFVDYGPQIREAAQRLANQGIAVYPVDANGGCRALDKTRDQGPFGFNDAPERIFGSLDMVADITGGRVVKYDNDPTTAVRLASRDHEGTYTVGFYANDSPDDQWRRLKVEIARKNVDLRYREGYFSVRSAQPKSWPAEAWKDLSNQPLTSTGIALNARAVPADGEVTVALQIASSDLYFHDQAGNGIADLEIGVIEQTGKGPSNVRVQPLVVTLNRPSDAKRSEWISVPTKWPLNKGTTSLRAIVRDRYTAKLGTVDIPIVLTTK